MKQILTLILSIFTVVCFGQNRNLINKGIESLEKENYKDAYEYFSAHIQDNPKDPDGYFMRAFFFIEVDEPTKAIKDLNNAINFFHKKATIPLAGIYELRAESYQKLDELDKALADINKSLKLDKNNEDALTIQAQIYYQKKDFLNSDMAYNKAIALDGKEKRRAVIGLARNQIEQKQFQKALDILNDLKKREPNYTEILRFRHQAYAGLENYNKAIDDVLEYISEEGLTSSLVEILTNYSLHKYNYVIAKVSAAINNNKERIGLFLLRSDIYLEHGKLKLALTDLEVCETLTSDEDNYLQHYIGKVYCEMGLYNKAIEANEKCYLVKNDPALFIDIGDCKRLQGKYNEAIALYSKVIELDPLNCFAIYRRAWNNEFLKNYSAALDDYDLCIEIDDEDSYYYLNRGQLLLKMGRKESARSDFQKVIELEMEIKPSLNRKQFAYFYLGNTVEAETHNKKILAIYPSKRNFYNASCLYSLMNKKNEAIAFLEKSFEMGYRDFNHINIDDDMDNIRNSEEFIALINTWKSKFDAELAEDIAKDSVVLKNEVIETKVVTINLKKISGGLHEIACIVNGIPLNFIYDSGASTVTISSIEAKFMMKNGQIKDADIVGKRNYTMASGEIAEGTQIILRSIKIGELELKNIQATVMPHQKAPLLLGQSALSKLGKIEIDNTNSTMTITVN